MSMVDAEDHYLRGFFTLGAEALKLDHAAYETERRQPRGAVAPRTRIPGASPSMRRALARNGRRCCTALASIIADPGRTFGEKARVFNIVTAAQSPGLARSILLVALRDHDENIRFYGLQTAYLASSRQHEWLCAELLAALRDPAPVVRLAGCQYLGSFHRSRRQRQVRDALLGVAADPREELRIRKRALSAVAYYRGRAVRHVLERLAGEGDGALAADATSLLANRTADEAARAGARR
jgi:hypothetical protein